MENKTADAAKIEKPAKKNFKFHWAKAWTALSHSVFTRLRAEFLAFMSELGYAPLNPRTITFYTENKAPAVYLFDAARGDLQKKDIDGPVSDLLGYKFYKDYTLYSPNPAALSRFFGVNQNTSFFVAVKIQNGKSASAEIEINLLNRKETDAIKTLDSTPAQREIPNGDFTLFGAACDLHENAPLLIQEFVKTFVLRLADNLDRMSRADEDEDPYDYVPDMDECLRDVVTGLLRNYCDPDLINILSGSTYERQEASGGILFCKAKNQVSYSVVFEKEIDFSLKNLRQIRKLLQTTDRKNFLIVNKNKVTGIGSSLQNIRTIRFVGHQKWALSHGGEELLRFWRGSYTIPNQNRNYIPKNIFSGEKNDKFANQLFIDTLKKQEHGALVIISETQNILVEVARLSGLDRGYRIEPINLKHTDAKGEYDCLPLLKNLTSIDGALFMDTNFIVHGVGVILDGIALNGGSSARGARYNSSKCYLDNRKRNGENFTAIVVSEDESIDVLLNFTPEESKKRAPSAAGRKK